MKVKENKISCKPYNHLQQNVFKAKGQTISDNRFSLLAFIWPQVRHSMKLTVFGKVETGNESLTGKFRRIWNFLGRRREENLFSLLNFSPIFFPCPIQSKHRAPSHFSAIIGNRKVMVSLKRSYHLQPSPLKRMIGCNLLNNTASTVRLSPYSGNTSRKNTWEWITSWSFSTLVKWRPNDV